MINSLDNNNTTVHSIVHIVSKEVYLQMKIDQKIINGKDIDPAIVEYNQKREEWENTTPLRPEKIPLLQRHKILSEYEDKFNAWRTSVPKRPWTMEADPRSINIVYAIVKGKDYKQVEVKVREGNEPRMYKVIEVCKHYGIDYNSTKFCMNWRS